MPNDRARKFTIVCRGNTEADLKRAFEEAVELIRRNYASGHNTSGPTASYSFEVSDDVGAWERPI